MKMSMLFAMVGIVCLGIPAYSQDQPEEPQPRARGGRAALSRVEPVITALDANQDNEISADEIANAAEALKGLDRDKNGKLTSDEVRNSLGGRRRFSAVEPGPTRFGQRREPEGGFGGPRGFGRDARGGPPGGEQDRGGPDRARPDRGGPDRGGPERGGPDRGGPDRGGPDRGGPDRDGPDRGGPDRGARGRGFGGFGPTSPEQFVARAMEFDADKDGELDKAELTALAERMGGGFRGGFGGSGDFRGRPEGPSRPGDRRGDFRPRPDDDR